MTWRDERPRRTIGLYPLLLFVLTVALLTALD